MDDKPKVIEFEPVLHQTLTGRPAKEARSVYSGDGPRPRARVIPKQFEALLVMIANTGVAHGNLTRAELDLNPRTKKLTNAEKNALIKHAPAFFADVERAKELQELRNLETEYALAAQKRATKMARKQGIDKMEFADQLKATSQQLAKQALDAALGLAATSQAMTHTDPLALELYKSRVKYIKDYTDIAKSLRDLGAGYATEAMEGDEYLTSLTDEAQEQLTKADELLIARGIRSSQEQS